MKTAFFKIGLFIALGLTTAVFYSCSDDDDNGGGNSGNASKITATNVNNSSTQVTTVKALADWWESYYDRGTDVIAQAPYINNGFTLELPEPLPDKYLTLFYASDMTELSISDKDVKVHFLHDGISGYDKDKNNIGNFYLEEENNDNYYYIFWTYADRDVTIKGEYKYYMGDYYEGTEKYDWKLKKGWNVVYGSEAGTRSYNDKYVYTATLTSQKPSGINYSWNFYGGYYASPTTAAKSVFSKLKEHRKNRTGKY